MRITRFVVQEGRIDERGNIDTDTLDPALLRAAADTLARLRAGQDPVPDPIPGGPELFVGLGVPRVRVPVERMTPEQREQWEASKDRVEREQRRTSFYLGYRGVRLVYHP